MQGIWNAGSWLSVVLSINGASPEDCSRICFCHGQRSVYASTIAMAVAYANEYEQTGTTQDQPGPELAERLIQEHSAKN